MSKLDIIVLGAVTTLIITATWAVCIAAAF